jgi:hypothetical protein
MLKSRELRIGNLVWSNDGHYERLEDVVKGIELTRLMTKYGKTTYIPIENIEPIPLTEEWLLKFGFRKENNFFFIDDYCIEQYLDTGIWKFSLYTFEDTWHFIDKSIQYVHSLQNLIFCLTGRELQFTS